MNQKNTSKLRTWDDASFFRRGMVLKTDKENPYKKSSLEGALVDFTIGLAGKHLSKKMSHTLLKYLRDKKILLSVDPWTLYDLIDRAVWLSLNAGCIKFDKKVNSRNKLFGVYLQSGLLDLFHEPTYLHKLILNNPNPQKTQHLQQVALIASDLKFQWGLPTIKENNDKIEISNYPRWLLERTESIPIGNFSLPIQTWCASTPEYVNAETRGIFHHLGDEMAFICAAIQYGDCYVVGNDEFGDLIVLGSIKKEKDGTATFSLGEICSPMDFDYIYSVPVSNPLYPSWRNPFFNYSSEINEQCKANNYQNAEISNAYWNNSYFIEQAQREIKEYTVKGFTNKLITSISSLLGEDYKDYQALFEPDLVAKFQLLINFYKINSKLTRQNAHTVFVNELLGELSYTQSPENYLNKIKTTILQSAKVANEVYHDYPHYKCGGKRSLKFIEQTLSDISTSILKINYLINKYQSVFENDFSYFYKTIAHKVHCDIINPKVIDKCGFFLKDGNTLKVQKFNLTDIFINLFFNEDVQSTDFLKFTLAQNTSKIQQKLKKQGDLLFNTHHRALKNSISEQMPKNDRLQDLIEYWDELDTPAFVVSDIIDMQNEYRIFVINGRPVAGSPCFRNTTPFNAWDNGRFDPRLCDGHSALDYYENNSTRSRVAQYGRFARKFAKELKLQYPQFDNYVLDVAYNRNTNSVVPIEINSVTWSGAYQIDFRRVCAAVAKTPYRKSELNPFGNYEQLLAQAKLKIEKTKNLNARGEEFLEDDFIRSVADEEFFEHLKGSDATDFDESPKL